MLRVKEYFLCVALLLCAALQVFSYDVIVHKQMWKPRGGKNKLPKSNRCPNINITTATQTFVDLTLPSWKSIQDEINSTSIMHNKQYSASFDDDYIPIEDLTHIENKKSPLRKCINKGKQPLERSIRKVYAQTVLLHAYLNLSYNIMKKQDIGNEMKDTLRNLKELNKTLPRLFRKTYTFLADLGRRKKIFSPKSCKYKASYIIEGNTNETKYIVSILKHSKDVVQDINKTLSSLVAMSKNCTLCDGNNKLKLKCSKNGVKRGIDSNSTDKKKGRKNKGKKRGKKNRKGKKQSERTKSRKQSKKCTGNEEARGRCTKTKGSKRNETEIQETQS